MAAILWKQRQRWLQMAQAHNLSPALDGTQQRLDVLIAQNEQIIALLRELPKEGVLVADEPSSESGVVQLKEPQPKRKAKA